MCGTCRKLALKLAQRVALAMLPPREAKWRYEKRCTDIGDTLAGTSDAGKLNLSRQSLAMSPALV